MKKFLLPIVLLLLAFEVKAQDAVSYQMPPKEIADLLLAKPTPTVSISSKADWLLLADRTSYPSVAELAMPELRIAGLRINPENFSPSRQNYISGFTLKNIKSGQTFTISGLPQPLKAGNMSWSPNEKKIVFTQTNPKGVDLYVIDIATKKAMKVNKAPLNVVLGSGIAWLDDQSLLYHTITKPASAAPQKSLMPKGPTIQENLGKAAPSATFEDLIKSPYDEQLFAFYATSQLVENRAGIETQIGKPAIYDNISLSPDKKYMMMRTIRKPFSYLVTAGGFPSTIIITDLKGKLVKDLALLPSTEGRPSGNDNVQNVDRDFTWRSDEAATVTWCHPLDSGLIKKKVEYHDALFELSAPFTGGAKELFKTQMRYRGTQWGTSTLALVTEMSRAKQTERVSRFNPSTGSLEKLYERNETDAYTSPGTPVTAKNKFGRQVIYPVDNGTKLLMNNTTGSSPKGDLPFLAKFDLNTKQTRYYGAAARFILNMW